MDWEYSAEIEPVEGLRQILDKVEQSGIESGNVANMDMDIDPSDYLIIVPDTNIWIGYPGLLKKLLSTDFERLSFPTIIIPWMVLQELDVLMKQPKKTNSSSGSNTNISRSWQSSKKSVAFIHELLMSRHPRVRGQKASEAVLAQQQFKIHNEDDHILQCALQCLEKSGHILVVFLTNDRNLLNKALVECSDEARRRLLICDSNSTIDKINTKLGIDVVTTSPKMANKSGTTKVPGVIPLRRVSPRRKYSSSSSTSATIPASSASTKVTSSPPRVSSKRRRERDTAVNSVLVQPISKRKNSKPSKTEVEARTRLISSTSCKSSVSPSVFVDVPTTLPQIKSKCDTFQDVINLLQDVFSYIIEFKMKEDFGEKLWKHSLKYKPPWSFETALKCLIHHYFGVFSFIFGIPGKSQVESLLSLVQEYQELDDDDGNPEHVLGKKQLEEDIIELSLTLIILGKTKSGSTEFSNNKKIIDCEKILSDYIKQRKL